MEAEGASFCSERASVGRTYSFVALTDDGRSPFLVVQTLDGGEDLAARARDLLERHGGCTRIEVWDGYDRLLVIGLGPAGLDRVGLD
jgi:hypothetical protein